MRTRNYTQTLTVYKMIFLCLRQRSSRRHYLFRVFACPFVCA